MIPIYADRCWRQVWPESPTTSVAERGICLYQLASLLTASEGKEKITALFEALEEFIQRSTPQDRSALLREVLDKFARE